MFSCCSRYSAFLCVCASVPAPDLYSARLRVCGRASRQRARLVESVEALLCCGICAILLGDLPALGLFGPHGSAAAAGRSTSLLHTRVSTERGHGTALPPCPCHQTRVTQLEELCRGSALLNWTVSAPAAAVSGSRARGAVMVMVMWWRKYLRAPAPAVTLAQQHSSHSQAGRGAGGGPGHRGQPRHCSPLPEYAELATASGAVTRRSRRQPATDM